VVLFVAEAPGRFGADRTGVPLVGDRSGKTFDLLLAAAGLDRDQIFVTNAVLCNPRDEQGRNAPPAASEIARCSQHLRETIALVDPRFVVALGVSALRGLEHVEPHDLKLSGDVGRPTPWFGRALVSLYHPSARAQIRRPLDQQVRDFEALGRLVRG
jgi:uracil-DNA glycosylase family 4